MPPPMTYEQLSQDPPHQGRPRAQALPPPGSLPYTTLASFLQPLSWPGCPRQPPHSATASVHSSNAPTPLVAGPGWEGPKANRPREPRASSCLPTRPCSQLASVPARPRNSALKQALRPVLSLDPPASTARGPASTSHATSPPLVKTSCAPSASRMMSLIPAVWPGHWTPRHRACPSLVTSICSRQSVQCRAWNPARGSQYPTVLITCECPLEPSTARVLSPHPLGAWEPCSTLHTMGTQ